MEKRRTKNDATIKLVTALIALIAQLVALLKTMLDK